MILYIVFGLIFLALVVIAVMSAKEFHWVNSLLLIFLFLSTAAASMGLAGVLHKRTKAVKKLSTIEKRLDKVHADYNKAVFGDADAIGFGKSSLRALSAQLDLLQVGRGRVWNGGKVAAADGEWTFTFPTAVPAGGENQLASLQEIEVHVFKEEARQIKVSSGPTQISIPVGYVGKFRIVEATLEGFLLEPVRIIDTTESSQPTGTWTVFEKMPLDRRGSFKDALSAINPEADIENISIGDFRRILETQFFPADNFPFDADSAEYEKLIDRYAFDGRSLGQIEKWVEAQINSGNRKSGAFQPPPEEVHVKYRFNKESQEYTVDADGNLDTDGAFTPLGLAIASNLHVGSKVKFKENDEVVIDSLTAAGYDRAGTQIKPFSSSADVTEVDRIYVRSNRDFPYLFARLSDRGIQRRENLVDRKEDNNLYDNAIAKNLAQQIQERTRIQSDLESDNKNLQNDRDTIVALLNRRQQQVDDMLAKIERLNIEQEMSRSRLGEISRNAMRDSTSQTTLPVSIEQPMVVEQPVVESYDIVQPIEQPLAQPIDGQIMFGTPQPSVPTPAQPLPRSIPLSQPNTPTLPSGSLDSFEVYE
jgi:hypothetical protein